MDANAGIKDFIQQNGCIQKAAKSAEQKSHICEKTVRDILDEIGDCLHDDLFFRRKIVNEVFLHPEMKRKIAQRFVKLVLLR